MRRGCAYIGVRKVGGGTWPPPTGSDPEGSSPNGSVTGRHPIFRPISCAFEKTGAVVPTDEATVSSRDLPSHGYRVLARKYRPSSFAELIGQEAMVRTLANAFATGRIAQGYMLTGVRGVGKTTTARIIARALNYETDTIDAPTLDMPVLGRHCAAIMESRHPDVLEMDAASHTGVDNMRDIIGNAQYRPIEARTKIFVIDEVHMLSKGAFNALLKTLEEPPEHVKFIFATTEIRKVPITILSRCQRFDLRRIEAAEVVAYLKKVCALERVEADDAALALIARAGEGSMRDSLSLLDQAIAYAQGRVAEEATREMLGLADRGRTIQLFGLMAEGDIAGALREMHAQHDLGADPGVVIADLLDIAHLVTRLKTVPGAASDPRLTQDERERGGALAEALSIGMLTRAWQMLPQGSRRGARRAQPARRRRHAAGPPRARLHPADTGGRPARAPGRGPAGAREGAGALPGRSGKRLARTAEGRRRFARGIPVEPAPRSTTSPSAPRTSASRRPSGRTRASPRPTGGI